MQTGVPPPVTNAPVLKGAWGARAATSAATEPPQKAPQPKPEDNAKPPEPNPLDVGVMSRSDPTPSGLTATETKPIRTTVPASGNVWATKGSAHLIQAEKPKPPAPVVPQPEPVPEALPTPALTEPALESGLPSAVTSANAWGKPTAPEPLSVPIEIPPASPLVTKTLPVPPVTPLEEEPVMAPQPPSPAAPVNGLNMGHWETGDGDDSQNLDFGFGSFGADAMDTAGTSKNVPAATPAAPKNETGPDASQPSASPARPPPGLSLGGMPPMPESAVMVHELENKMESATLDNKKQQVEPTLQSKQISATLPTQPNGPMPGQALPSVGGITTQQTYNQYGTMAGVYNYSAAAAAAAGNAFVGIQGAPVLPGGVLPQQPGKPQGGGITQPSVAGQPVPQQGLYGTQPQPAPSSGNAGGTNSASTTETAPAPTPAGIPPGMPGAIPYANPALAHYGQQQFYMGQQGIGYNYGYGFGGVAQGGYGYQQVMGQSQGYPHYDDQSHQATSHHSGGTGGYQKSSGGAYRGGRNNHHSNNQYQNQYNPQQHGGYSGQPYGMGYHQEHFNQRGGYGPGGMADHYGMQQGSGNYQNGGGFQDDDQQKGKKGGRANGTQNSSLQQGPPSQLGGQQTFGLQSQGSEPTPSTAGGWSNQSGGWSGGAPSWQGN